jgi:DNA-binding NarL/FixJ family response regulator
MRSVRILLVDDSSEFLDCAAKFLAGHSHFEIVGSANSGEKAVELVEALSPDLVLMDMAMPRMNGVEATRSIKSLPDPPRVIVVSLHQNPEYRVSAQKAGADDMINKDNFAQALFPAIARQFPLLNAQESI